MLLVYTLLPSQEKAESLGKILLERRLAACVNILSPCQSLFWWEGKIEKSQEIPLFIKTREELKDQIFETIRSVHPYECPPLLAFSPTHVSKDFERWIEEQTVSS